jgi:hypothetical protein
MPKLSRRIVTRCLEFRIYVHERRIATSVKRWNVKAYWKNGNIDHVRYFEQFRSPIAYPA